MKILKLITNRGFTNIIHFIIDELIPPIIRDKKWFMYPLFHLAYKGENIKKYMEFKSNYYSINNEDLEKWYHDYKSVGSDRETDLNKKSLNYIIKNIDEDCSSLLDVACGRGFFLDKLKSNNILLTGVDLFENLNLKNAKYIKANLEALPFEDELFDIVVSSHTLEHIINIRRAVSEIKRVAKKKVIITVPCQRYNYYTLDLHLHFFPKKEMLINLIGIKKYQCEKKGGDWVYIGYLEQNGNSN